MKKKYYFYIITYPSFLELLDFINSINTYVLYTKLKKNILIFITYTLQETSYYKIYFKTKIHFS